MNPRALVLLGVLGLSLGLGLANADHVYSHRFMVDGRLVGIDGAPLPGRAITVDSMGEDFLEPCREGMQPVTDAAGDFFFCYHHHELEPTTRVNVTYGNVTVSRIVDVATRRVPVLLREPNETGVATDEWNRSYRILGRAWSPGPTLLENVQVFGVAVIGLPVNLTVRFEDGSEQVFRSTTNGYGDYDLVVETEADPSTLALSIEARGNAQPVQLESFFHRAYAPIYITSGSRPDEAAPTVDADGSAQPPARASAEDLQPGNTTPRVNPVLVVAVALGLVAAIVLSRRKGA